MPSDFKQHPIQLTDLYVRELRIDVHQHPHQVKIPDKMKVSFNARHHGYDSSSHQIQIDAMLQIGEPKSDDYKWKDGDVPFFLRTAIAGKFKIDPNNFPEEKVEEWANQNGVMVLLPYLRENATALSVRAGFKAIILPLIEIPTYQVQPPSTPGNDNLGQENN